MGNSHSVPIGNRERLSDCLRRLFRDKSNKDRLVDSDFKEEQKQQKKRERKGKSIWKRIKKRLKTDDRTAEDKDSPEAFHRRHTGCQEVQSNCCQTQLDGETQLGECSHRKGTSGRWTNPKENVISPSNTPPQDGDVTFGIASVTTPCRAVRNSKSPTFQLNVPPKFDWRMENLNRRDVQDMCSGKETSCTHKDKIWFNDNLANLTCDSDDDSEDEKLEKWNETGNDGKMPSAVKDIYREKKCKNIETYINNAKENTDLRFSELQVLERGVNDHYNKHKECDGALKEQCLPSQRNLEIGKETQHARNNDICGSFSAVSLRYWTNRDPNTSTHFAPKEAKTFYDDTHSISSKNRELFTPGSGFSDSNSNKDKILQMDPENTLNCHQALDFDTFFIGRDIKSSDLGLTRIERYLAAQIPAEDERASTSLSRKSPKQERKSYDMPLFNIPDTNGSQKALAHENSPVLQMPTQVGSGLPKDDSSPVPEVIAQPKRMSHKIHLAPMLELTTQPKCVLHEIPISLVIEITTQQKCAEIKNERTEDKDCPCILAFKQCKNSEVESVKCQPNIERVDSTNDTDTNDELEVSPVQFDSEKIHDKKQNANKVSRCTQTENDFASDNMSNIDIDEDKRAERNVQTKDTICVDIEADDTSENKDKKEILKSNEYPETNIKTAEVLFASFTGLTHTDTDVDNVKANLGKGLPNKVNQLNETIIESSSNIDCIKLENEETQINITEKNNLERAVIKNKKAETFFVSLGPSVLNVSPDEVKANFAKRFPNKIKQTLKMEKNDQSMDVSKDDTGYSSELVRVDASYENISTKMKFPEKEIEITGNGTKYGSLQDHIQAKEESLTNKKGLDKIQTEGNISKMNSKNKNFLQNTAKYGSVSHYDSIKKDNVLKNQIIQNMQTKEDSWKTNEQKDSCLQRNNSIKNYVVAPKTAQYGSVEHNDKIKRDNASQKEKIDNIQTTLDTWKTKETDYSYLQPKIKTHVSARKQAEYGSVKHYNQIKKDNALRKIRIGEIQSNLDSWGASNPGSKYSIQRKDEWEPVLDHKKFGTAAHFHQIKDDNAIRQRRLSKIQSNIDSWNTPNPGSKYSIQRKDEWEPVLDHKKFGTAAHFHQIKDDNAIRQRRLSKIQSNIDSWNTPNPGSKFSIQRKDEWEPVLDHKKFGTAAHFHQIKDDNAIRQRRLSKIQSNIDSWNAPNPGSKFSLKRKGEWEPVLDTRKYGSVAHYHQVRETNTEKRYKIKKALTKLNTWQTKNKLNLLQTQRQRETDNIQDEIPNASLKSGRPEEFSVNSLPHSSHRLSTWSRHDNGISKPNRSYIPVRKAGRSYRNVMPGAISGQF